MEIKLILNQVPRSIMVPIIPPLTLPLWLAGDDLGTASTATKICCGVQVDILWPEPRMAAGARSVL